MLRLPGCAAASAAILPSLTGSWERLYTLDVMVMAVVSKPAAGPQRVTSFSAAASEPVQLVPQHS